MRCHALRVGALRGKGAAESAGQWVAEFALYSVLVYIRPCRLFDNLLAWYATWKCGVTMKLRAGLFPISAAEFPHIVEVWEASVRATHHFVREVDIELFRPLVLDALPHVEHLHCVRADTGEAVGFIGVANDTVEMLFVHPAWRGKGAGRRLLAHAIDALGATRLDVNEQNETALGFYLHMGFEVVGRSEVDGMGKPYPLLHMRLRNKFDSR